MELRFHPDLVTGLPHIYDHGVTEDEVREVLARPAENRAGSENSYVAAGQTNAGRYLTVVYAPDAHGDGAFVITAYELRGRQLRAFRRRRRRKGK
jgi:hypothetical protein